ncbi:hypothetical protein [Pseudonocardia sp. GCM10023141]|uniref:hypothetical protein n=1 Tax=Pseudonocardia sp. GCM10023141 TaxID=3252653 RepID=UPI00360B58EA
MKITVRGAAALLVTTAALVAGCSSPPGPAPASPAPALPADAIAYDALKSTDRPFPFTNSCKQITAPVLAAVSGRKATDIKSLAGPAGCMVAISGNPELEQVWLEPKSPPNPSEPRYFPLLWDGKGASTYHRRLIFAGRYYAVETIDFYGGQPGCFLTVDTGSPTALQFRGILPEKFANTYPELNPGNTGYEIDHEGTQKFMDENCPVVEKIAGDLIEAVDPRGGSLATA